MKNTFLIILIICTLGCTVSNQNGSEKVEITEKGNLKSLITDYAVCTCIEYGYKKQGINLKDPSRSVLMDLSEYSISAQMKSRIDSTAYNFVDSIEPLQPADYGGQKDILYKCLEFGRGKELRILLENL